MEWASQPLRPASWSMARSAGDQQLVRVQARVVVAEVLDLQMLDGLDDARGDQRQLLVDARQRLEGVDQAGRGRAQQRGRLAGDDAPVVELERDGGAAGVLRLLQRSRDDRTVRRGGSS